MIKIFYCPREDQIYEYDGIFLTARNYCDVGGCIDETGASYYTGTIAAYGSVKEYDLVKLGTLEGPK